MTDFNLAELHILINEVLNPQFQISADLWRRKCQRLEELLDSAKGYVQFELSRVKEEPKEQSIRHTLDNTVLEQLPDEIEDNNPLTIHGEK